MARTILITGGGGNLGRKLNQHFTERGHSVRLLDRDAQGNAAVHEADLSVWGEPWVSLFKGVDCVFHLAGNPSPSASWASIQQLNFDLTLNVYEAAARQGAKRLVFASSNWVMAGHRFADERLTPDAEPYPVNAYGVSKLIGERLGKSYSERWGLSVICFRIGYNQRDEGNQPGIHMQWNSWGQLMWVSDRDLCGAFEAAVNAPPTVRFAVLNLMSNNPGMRWQLDELRDVLGFEPADGHAAIVTDEMRGEEESAKKARGLIEVTEAFLADRRW